MPNWCFNQIEFTGEEANVQKVISLFLEMREREIKTNEGQKPEFSELDDYFFSISVDDNYISFESRWSPIVGSCVEIAKNFDLNFQYTYDESGNQIFGKAIYTAGNEGAEELDLSDADFDLFDYDEENDCYNYNGETHESDNEIKELIFEKKFDITY